MDGMGGKTDQVRTARRGLICYVQGKKKGDARRYGVPPRSIFPPGRATTTRETPRGGRDPSGPTFLAAGQIEHFATK